MSIPFLNLKPQHQALKQEILAAVEQVLDSTTFAGGPFVAKFEDEFAAFCHAKHAVGVGNGTDALWFALLALGIGPGDEVITVPNTFIATAEAITATTEAVATTSEAVTAATPAIALRSTAAERVERVEEDAGPDSYPTGGGLTSSIRGGP